MYHPFLLMAKLFYWAKNSPYTTRGLYHNTYLAVIYSFRNKLECLSLASFSRIV
jgi:hypothetical protein